MIPTRVHLGNVNKIALSQQTCSPLPTNHILRKINKKTYLLPILKNLRGVYLPIRTQPTANEMLIPKNLLIGWTSRVKAHQEDWRLVLLYIHHNNPMNKTWYLWNECQTIPVRGVYVPMQNPTILRHPVEHQDIHIRWTGLYHGTQKQLYIWHSSLQTYKGQNLEKATA